LLMDEIDYACLTELFNLNDAKEMPKT